MSISSLPVGASRIQAVYNGAPNDLSSVSPILTQTVNRLATVTVLSLSSQVKANGQIRYFLVATTTTSGAALVPSGTVVFRKNGALDRQRQAQERHGRADAQPKGRSERSIRRQVPGKRRFLPSTSAPIVPAEPWRRVSAMKSGAHRYALINNILSALFGKGEASWRLIRLNLGVSLV